MLTSLTRLLSFWEYLRTSFWFLPSIMAVSAIALSSLLVNVDSRVGDKALRNIDWLYAFGPASARAILSAIAGSMITVAGLTFSITMLTLQLASSQFGPRLLRNFMRDRGNQVVLGTFITTFVYCLLVLGSVRGTDESGFVPLFAVTFGMVLAVTSLAILIYFIHHVATGIRIETLLMVLTGETRQAIDRLYPSKLGDGASANRDGAAHSQIPSDFEKNTMAIEARISGYVQLANADALTKLACDCNLILRIESRPGRFVSKGKALLVAYPRDRLTDQTVNQLRSAFVVGHDRTPEQDVEFSLWRIVEIAQRVLSPGVNDPTTALYCIDRLEESLCLLAGREVPSPLRLDDDGHVRIITGVHTLDELACPLFAAIARYAMADADVILRLLAAMNTLGQVADPEPRKQIMDLYALINRESIEHMALSFDQSFVRAAVANQ